MKHHPPRRDVQRYVFGKAREIVWERRDEAAILAALDAMGKGEGVRCG